MAVKNHFIQAEQVLHSFIANEQNFVLIEKAIEVFTESLQSGGKIISCGNGGSMCDAMHFAEELTGRYRENRPGIAAISISDPSHITCVGNDYGFEFVFSRFVESIGKKGDVLLAISTSGNSQNVINAAKAAKAQGMRVVGLTGKNGGALASLCDIEVRAPESDYADRVQEIHIKIIHAMIDGIENKLIETKTT
jgi:D-sedoheptulose 7-phosphate isomerase